jgi:PAS domain S-box-containing protein
VLTESRPASVKERGIKEEQVALLFAALPTAMFATLMITGVICFIFWAIVPSAQLIGWAMAVVAFSLVRGGLSIAYRRDPDAGANADKWLNRFAGTLAIHALILSSAVWLIYPDGDLSNRLLLILVIIGIACGGAITLAAHLPSVVLFVIAMLTPLVFRFVLDDELPFLLGPMTIVLAGLLIGTSRDLTRFIGQTFRLQQEKETVINDLRLSEQAQSENESRYRQLFDTAKVSIWDEDLSGIEPVLHELRQMGVTDLREYLDERPEEVLRIAALVRINSVNDATLWMYGVESKAEFIDNLDGIMTAETLGGFTDVLCAIWNNEAYYSSEVSHKTFDGREITVVFSLPIPRTPAEWQHVPVSVVDITGRKVAESELKVSEVKLSGILDMAPEAIITTDHGGKVRMFNQGAQSLFGYEESEMIGELIDKIIPERFRTSHVEKMAGFRESSVDTRRMTERSSIFGLRKDGTEFPAEASVTKLVIGEEQIFNVMLHDITQRQRIEREMLEAREVAEAASRTKSEFLANMSHELRSPLNAVLGFSEIISSEVYGPLHNEKYKEYAGDIHSAGVHLLELIDDVLDVSKIEAGALELAEGEMDMNLIVRATLRLIKERAFKKSVSFDVVVAPDLPLVRGDERAIKQILLNLLSNSVKFTDAGGSISINCECNPLGGVTFAVTDTGVGIAASDIEKVMEPFGQVADADTREHAGTGLGLPLARKLAELHDAVFELESEIGKGTTVRVSLPPERSVETPNR